MPTRRRVITSLTDLADQHDKGLSIYFEGQEHPITQFPMMSCLDWVRDGKLFVYEQYVEDPDRITIEELQHLNRWLNLLVWGSYGLTPKDTEIREIIISKLEKQIRK